MGTREMWHTGERKKHNSVCFVKVLELDWKDAALLLFFFYKEFSLQWYFNGVGGDRAC